MELIQLKNNESKNKTITNYNQQFQEVIKNQKIIKYHIIILFTLIIILIIYLYLDTKKNLNTKIKCKLLNTLENNSKYNNEIHKYIEINNNILNSYIEKQNDFCINPEKYYNKEIEDSIKLCPVILNNIKYNMFIYKGLDVVSKTIVYDKYFEPTETNNIYLALKYYGKKNKITNNKDIFMLDIGGNIGWYPIFMGRFGYSIITFEPFERNYYVLRKNYCYLLKDLNINITDSNIIIINKGLSNEEKKCDYYRDVDNIGNGMVLCDEVKNDEIKKEFSKVGEIFLTKLSNFMPFLSLRNLALIKIDVEGMEGKVIEGGIELIKRFHIPFILVEFTPRALIEHGTDPKKFLKIFLDNGYKMKTRGFFSEINVSINKIVDNVKELVNIYLVYDNYEKKNK